MRTYHEVAGRTDDNTVGFKFDAEGQRSGFYLFDSYCENPACPGWEIMVSLIALEPAERKISFDVNFHKNEMAAVGELSPDDLAIAKEFCNSKATANLLLRRRQLVRAAGLAEQKDRLGPKKRFTGSCYAWMDFDKQGDRFQIFFEIGQETWSVLDQYCVIPQCSCQDAVLTFYHHTSDITRAAPVFDVRLDLDGGEVRRGDHGRLSPANKQVMDKFLESFPGWKHELGLRRSFMRKIATQRIDFAEPVYVQPPVGDRPEAHAPLRRPLEHEVATTQVAAPASASKVGRNDPCPCGSGRKYKKCCGK